MSNIGLIIEERETLIGDFLVGRLLPFRRKRAVGPFVFIDHMGPVQLKEYENFDVPPHPHIGLSTLTYLFEGAITHRDSLGTEMDITPGAVNWMTAGKGVVHSERTPQALRNATTHLHGLQIWVALPKDLQECEPSFVHVEATQLPAWEHSGVQMKLIAGQAFGKRSPVPVFSNLYFIEIQSEAPQLLNLGDDLYGESGLYILKGTVQSEGNTFGEKQLLIANNTKLCTFELGADSTVYLFGGEPFPEERFIHWNFVSSERALIEKAKEDWQNQRFPKVPNETDFVPLPEPRRK